MFYKFLAGFVIAGLKSLLTEDKKRKIIVYINDNVDIPKLTEEQERQLIKGIINGIEFVVMRKI